MLNPNKKNTRRDFFKTTAKAGVGLTALTALAADNPDKAERLVVLTFDDAVKTQRTLVGPLLKELGFGASFFVTHRWMVDDPEHYLTWDEIAELHEMGFEIGNHSWTHPSFSVPKDAARLPAELALVERALRRVGVPKPVSFAWCGNAFGPEAVRQLDELGYQFARRGMQPEAANGKTEIGPTFDPRKNHPLLVPTTGDANPNWTLAHFQAVVERARAGQVVVLQFHGVPDPHAWVNTLPERFREYMAHLKGHDFKVISLRDVKKFPPVEAHPADPLTQARFPDAKSSRLVLPTEMQATRARLDDWLPNMVSHHHYTLAEVATVTGLDIEVLNRRANEIGLDRTPAEETKAIRVLPYPGGRHPRKGFLNGAVLPLRGTKVSVFLPWDRAGYVVVDLPEAIFSEPGLIFLAHTDVPTVWDERNVWVDNVDWERRPNGGLSRTQRLPNQVAFGASVQPASGHVDMELWLRNDSPANLTGLRTQICVMLAGAADFDRQTNDHKVCRSPVAAARSATGDRWIVTAWNRCGNAWGNAPVPCLHADPVLPDCAPGETVRVNGRLWFYEGDNIEHEMERTRQSFAALTP